MTATVLGRRWPVRGLVPAAVAGALAPDLDLLLWLADRSVHHHAWPSHWPVVWLGLVLVAAVGCVSPRTRPAAILGLVFAGNGFLHQILDTVAGDVRWLAPASERAWSLVHVSRRFEPWWLNFLVHPTFVLELVLVAVSVVVYRTDSRSKVTCAATNGTGPAKSGSRR